MNCTLVWSPYPTATVLQVWGEQERQKMVLGSGKKLALSPVWCQWQTTMPFSSPDTTRLLSTGDQCTAVTGVCVEKKKKTVILFILHVYYYNTSSQAAVESFSFLWLSKCRFCGFPTNFNNINWKMSNCRAYLWIEIQTYLGPESVLKDGSPNIQSVAFIFQIKPQKNYTSKA